MALEKKLTCFHLVLDQAYGLKVLTESSGETINRLVD